MKFLLTFSLAILSFSSQAQFYNINPEIRDSLSTSAFHYHVAGVGEFSDSVILHVELLGSGEVPVVEFSGVYDFSNPSTSSLSAFVYDTTSEEFSFDLGNYATKDLFLHMWIEMNGEIKNEIYYKQ